MSKAFIVEYAKTDRSSCKNVKCKGKIAAGELRIGKVGPSPYGDGDMTNWFHAGCVFDAQTRQRADSKKIDSSSVLSGFGDLKAEDQKKIEEFIAGKNIPSFKDKPKKKKKKADSENDDGGSDSDDQPKKKAKAAPKKKASKKKADSDDDGSDGSAEVVRKTKRGPPKSRA